MIRVRPAFYASVLAGLVACSAPHSPLPEAPRPHVAIETPVWIDGRFSESQRDAVERALARWNAALGGERQFFVANDELERPHDWLLLSGPMSWGATVSFNRTTPPGVPGEVLAQVFAGSDVQFYGDHMASLSYEWVALHEFGHVLGLADNEPGACLMSHPLRVSCQCIDHGTVVALGARRLQWTGSLTAECP